MQQLIKRCGSRPWPRSAPAVSLLLFAKDLSTGEIRAQPGWVVRAGVSQQAFSTITDAVSQGWAIGRTGCSRNLAPTAELKNYGVADVPTGTKNPAIVSRIAAIISTARRSA